MANWIKNLKEGDLVIVESNLSSRIAKVEKITPSGLIKVNGVLYNKDGFMRGGDSWNMPKLREATDEAVQQVRDIQLIAKAKALMHSEKAANINGEQAEAIIKILEGDDK